MYRRVKNNRLAATGYLWAFAALTKSPAARAHYDQCRARGDRHAAALRHLFNRMIGQLRLDGSSGDVDRDCMGVGRHDRCVEAKGSMAAVLVAKHLLGYRVGAAEVARQRIVSGHMPHDCRREERLHLADPVLAVEARVEGTQRFSVRVFRHAA